MKKQNSVVVLKISIKLSQEEYKWSTKKNKLVEKLKRISRKYDKNTLGFVDPPTV